MYADSYAALPLADLEKGYAHISIALAVACREMDVRHVTALIVGPPDTPYEFGFFEVAFCACAYSYDTS